MAKRPLSQDYDEEPNSRLRKRSRINISSVPPTFGITTSTTTLRRLKRPRNTSLDTFQDDQGKTKKPKIDHTSDRQTRSPSPWPIIHCQAEQPIDPTRTAQRAYRRQRIRQALERSLEYAFTEQERYIGFRKQTRLPSPACSEQSVDPDVDEFGHTPAMLGLEDADDARIEEVFGSKYAQACQLRKRAAQSKQQISPQVPNTNQAALRTKQRARNKIPQKEVEKLIPNESQRRTRRHQHGHIFYELDPRGRARAIQGTSR